MKNQAQFPTYYMSEAAEVVYANLSEALKRKYDLKTIRYILELEDDYCDEIGLNIYPGQEESIIEEAPVVDEHELRDYIIKRAAENNLHFEREDISEILYAELIYLEMISKK